MAKDWFSCCREDLGINIVDYVPVNILFKETVRFGCIEGSSSRFVWLKIDDSRNETLKANGTEGQI